MIPTPKPPPQGRGLLSFALCTHPGCKAKAKAKVRGLFHAFSRREFWISTPAVARLTMTSLRLKFNTFSQKTKFYTKFNKIQQKIHIQAHFIKVEGSSTMFLSRLKGRLMASLMICVWNFGSSSEPSTMICVEITRSLPSMI